MSVKEKLQQTTMKSKLDQEKLIIKQGNRVRRGGVSVGGDEVDGTSWK